MAHAGLNTICPVCGAHVPETMPPMEVIHTSHLDDRALPMLRVCCPACAQAVNENPDLYYRAARANIRASQGIQT